jgi:peptide/nickel transport system substrate-binding protein
MPDPTQQVNALIAGEIDMIENVPHDLLPLLKADKNVQTVNWNPLGQQFCIRFNYLTKPFDNLKIRQAALLCMRQEDYLKATVASRYYKICTAAFPCGTPNGGSSRATFSPTSRRPGASQGSRLRRHAGRADAVDHPARADQHGAVTKSLLEQAGFKVDMQSMDWQTVVTPPKKDPADKGGWSASTPTPSPPTS